MLLALLLGPGSPWPARAQAGQTINVANGDVAGLISSIQTLNANGGGTIDLASGGAYSVSAPSDWWYGPNAFPAIASAITINGNGATISRASSSPKFRFFYVSGGFSTLPAGRLTLADLTLTGGLAQGGNGGNSGGATGGGGAGMGGAIYNQGSLSLVGVTFTSNLSKGGSAGVSCDDYPPSPACPSVAGGGGGGMGGDGAGFGGGGGGFRYNGGEGGGGFEGSEGGAPYPGGTYSPSTTDGGSSSVGGDGGTGFESGGGGGGYFPNEVGGNAVAVNTGGAGAYGAGSGGGFPANYVWAGVSACGSGGGGAFGGGGARDNGACPGNVPGFGGGGGVGGGGGSGQDGGGNGGYGGGGSGSDSEIYVNGGFGGGGGFNMNPYVSAASGGFGASPASPVFGDWPPLGGGGAGFGGAIFNQLGLVSVIECTFASNSAAGGWGYGTAHGFGGAIFNLNGVVLLDNVPYWGNTAVDSGGNADGGAFVYNLSHNGGNVSASQTATTELVLTNTTISTTNGDLTNNQVDGTAAVLIGSSGPIAGLFPSAVSFGSIPVGYPVPAQSATLTNLGNGALAISNVSLMGSGAFSISGNNCGSTLAAGASCQVSIAMSDTPVGTYTGQLTFSDNSSESTTQIVSLNGSRVQQSAVTQLGFGSAPPANVWPGWNAGSAFTVVEETAGGVQNYSAADLIGLIITGPGSFSQTFAATASGGIATFNLSGLQLTTPGAYTYRAFTAPSLALTQAWATQTVGGGSVGVSSSAATLTLAFMAAGELSTIQVLTQGAPNLDFAEANGGACATDTAYTAGQTCTVNVTFTPTVPGTRYGAVVLQDGSGNTLATGYLQGTASGPQIDYLPGAQPTLLDASVLGQPSGVAVDGSGNIYVADESNYVVLKDSLSAGSYTEGTISTSPLSAPQGVAVDGAGNVYIADFGNNRILKETPSGSGYLESSITSSNLQNPCGVAVDGSGNVYVADSASYQIYKETPSGSTYTESTVPVSNPTYPSVLCGVAVDGSGNVYVADTYNGRLLKEALSGGSYTESTLPIGSGATPTAVAVDGNGNVYYSDSSNTSAVFKDTLSSGNYTLSTVPTSGLYAPTYLTVDGYGNVFIADSGNFRVVKEDFADAPSLRFPTSTWVGSIDTADGAMTVNVMNIGNQPLVFTASSTGGNPSYPANFRANTGDGNLCSSGAPLAPNAACDISVEFEPTGAGLNSGSVVLMDNDLNQTNATQSIALSGTGFVKPAPAIKWANPPGITYGTALSAAQLNAADKIAGAFVYSPAAGTVLNAGTQTLTVTFTPTDPGYSPATATVKLVVTKAELMVMPHSPLPGTTQFSVGYGDDAPYLSDLYSITGFWNGDTSAVVSGAPTVTPVWGTHPNVGTYPLLIGIGNLSAANYYFVAASGTITVVPSVLTVKPNGASMKYGNALPAFGYQVTGLKYGQTASVLSAAPTVTTTATSPSGVGTYPISVNLTGITASNYTLVAGPDATLTINPATLTARANNIGMKLGETIPALTYTVTGFENGDTSSVLTGTATLSTTATSSSPLGTYPIAFATESLTAANYKVVYAGGNLTVRSH
jgi:hypothetical protein